MKVVCLFLQIAIPFFWLGLVIGLSFIEAPLKFQAPEITLERGLGIGRIVFSALNKIEIVLAVLLGFSVYRWRPKVSRTVVLALILLVLGGQTLWLLPILDERAVKIIAGKEVEESIHHFVYIVFEIVKVLGLLIFGIWTFKDFFAKTKKIET